VVENRRFLEWTKSISKKISS